MGHKAKQRHLGGEMSWWEGDEKVIRMHFIRYELVNKRSSKNVSKHKRRGLRHNSVTQHSPGISVALVLSPAIKQNIK